MIISRQAGDADVLFSLNACAYILLLKLPQLQN